jgi:hypothetical protein
LGARRTGRSLEGARDAASGAATAATGAYLAHDAATRRTTRSSARLCCPVKQPVGHLAGKLLLFPPPANTCAAPLPHGSNPSRHLPPARAAGARRQRAPSPSSAGVSFRRLTHFPRRHARGRSMIGLLARHCLVARRGYHRVGCARTRARRVVPECEPVERSVIRPCRACPMSSMTRLLCRVEEGQVGQAGGGGRRTATVGSTSRERGDGGRRAGGCRASRTLSQLVRGSEGFRRLVLRARRSDRPHQGWWPSLVGSTSRVARKGRWAAGGRLSCVAARARSRSSDAAARAPVGGGTTCKEERPTPPFREARRRRGTGGEGPRAPVGGGAVGAREDGGARVRGEHEGLSRGWRLGVSAAKAARQADSSGGGAATSGRPGGVPRWRSLR